jgi:uncharacterized protein (TIGR02453 family)
MIKQQILEFLKRLENNNNREWFEKNKNEFKRHQAAFKAFNEGLLSEMLKHDELEGMKIFRIYRDVRFSKNKTPYKSHFASSFKRIKPQLRGGYYVHIKPKQSFIATGFWNPVKEDLFRIRKEFEIDASEFKGLINEKVFKAYWGGLEGDEVKTAPRGFPKDHEDIELIRKKQFVFTRKFKDEEVVSPDFLSEVNDSFRQVRPFFDYMTEVLTTDLNGVSLLD